MPPLIPDICLCFSLFLKLSSNRNVDGIIIETNAKIVAKTSLSNSSDDALIIIGQHVPLSQAYISHVAVLSGYIDLPN